MKIRIEWKEKEEGLYLDRKKIFERLKELLKAENEVREANEVAEN